MEDKRSAIAIFICIVFTVFYMETFVWPYTRPKQVEVPASPASQAAPAGGAPQQPAQPIIGDNAVSDGAAALTTQTQTSSHPTPAQLEEFGTTIVETEKTIVSITHLGGRIASLKLKQHHISLKDTHPLDLISRNENTGLPLGVYSGNFNDEMVVYTVSNVSGGVPLADGGYSVSPSLELSLSLIGQFPSGAKIIKLLKFYRSSYAFDVNVTMEPPLADGSRLWVEWSHFAAESDVHARLNPKAYTIIGIDSEYKHVTLPEIRDGVSEFGSNLWVALGDQYFVTALVPSERSNNTRLGRNRAGQDGYAYVSQASGGTPSAGVASGNFRLFVGAKDVADLRASGSDLHRVRDLGIFSFIADPLLMLLRAFYGFIGNWGLAIVLLTLVIKALFLPLTRASFVSMRKMQEIQPEMKELRERIKDPTELNREMMALYKRRGVNPMGGCFPVLIQIPVFLGLYNALLNSIELRHAPFALWISDLSAPESPVPVMVILMGISMIVQQWLTPSAMDPAQRKAMLIMPVVFTLMFIVFPFPSGLVLYWFINNIISITQQVYIKGERSTTPLKATLLGSLIIFGISFVLTRL